ncbi:MAG: hypothetical protein K9J37_11980 [Saprospiraceae bacterium]|nr:hypothetical protein [Saprospiraceae bacterium]MCF8250627.1 hypothetical protein [Saprospiraceae bacterium]MCF8282402.1 hypothetical protein [Bacteroidales bacterium]MCF8312258.1 hypothetical protein [Saprospiraceae bacterium]MCF8442815.1 hypothetical protein [Saprospiraceae bacterium]
MPPNLLEQATRSFKKSGSSALDEHRVLFICLGLSLLVWFFVKMTQTYESRGQLELNYQTPIGLVFAEPPLRSMPFKFSGTGWNLLGMSVFQKQPGINFSLTSAPTQELRRTDISQKIEDELRLNLIELGQDVVSIRLDSLFSKKVRIQADTTIRFQNGYYFRDTVQLSPDSILVYGAAKMLDGISAVLTEPLILNDQVADFQTTLKLVNPNPELLQFSAKQTVLFLPIEQFTEKKFTVPILVLNARDSIRLVPNSVELRCVLGVSRYKQVSIADFKVVADFGENNGLDSMAKVVPLKLAKQPNWVRSVSITPRVVEYLIVR